MACIMIGWWILVAAQTPEELEAAADPKAAVLASWEASVAGIDWVDRLVKEGKARQLLAGGYPNRYTAKASDVLPLISDGPPDHIGPTVFGDDYVMPGNWSGNVTIHRDKFAACPPEKVLTVEVWDQS
jgi:hypothetical protein